MCMYGLPPVECIWDWRKGAMRMAWLLGPMSKKGKYISCYLQYGGLFSNTLPSDLHQYESIYHLLVPITCEWLHESICKHLHGRYMGDLNVDIGCLCTSYCLLWHIFSDYFSCFLSRLIRWLVAFVLLCFSLFGLFVVLKFLSPVSLLFSLWHWAQECSFVDYLNTYRYHLQHIHAWSGNACQCVLCVHGNVLPLQERLHQYYQWRSGLLGGIQWCEGQYCARTSEAIMLASCCVTGLCTQPLWTMWQWYVAFYYSTWQQHLQAGRHILRSSADHWDHLPSLHLCGQ